jgi:hypothetical protein
MRARWGAEKGLAALDGDMDSLFVLPLHLVPFNSETLSRSRLIKNGRLRGVVEVFSGQGIGSGQIEIADLPQFFDWANGEDMRVLEVLAPLPSYDVFSLRRTFREHGIQTSDPHALTLSPDKTRELTQYMARFTTPLIQRVYGDAAEAAAGLNLQDLFEDPDVKKTLARLRIMAKKLGIPVEQLPRFIEDYADIFMSLAYYTQCVDRLMPVLDAFAVSLIELKQNFMVRNDRKLVNELEQVEKLMRGLSSFVTRTLATFGTLSDTLWTDLTPAKFSQLRAMVHSTQLTVGSVLCALTVKLSAWQERFPKNERARPRERIDFIMNEMREGLHAIVVAVRGTDAPRPRRDINPTPAANARPGGAVSLLSPDRRKIPTLPL